MISMFAAPPQAAPAGGATPGGIGGLGWFPLQLIIIAAIFYFLILRPQQKQRQKHDDALKQLKKGDEIVTTGGIVGRVVHIKESVTDGKSDRTPDDRVTIDSGDSRLVIERGRISKIVGGSSAS
jgi:preprotein translocase subunit YajC